MPIKPANVLKCGGRLIGLLLATLGAAAAAEKSIHVPSQIVGRWSAASCSAGLPDYLQFAGDAAEVGSTQQPSTCRQATFRELTGRRWYVDLACADGSLHQLDLYLVERDRLSVATRPLGEACFYDRERTTKEPGGL